MHNQEMFLPIYSLNKQILQKRKTIFVSIFESIFASILIYKTTLIRKFDNLKKKNRPTAYLQNSNKQTRQAQDTMFNLPKYPLSKKSTLLQSTKNKNSKARWQKKKLILSFFLLLAALPSTLNNKSSLFFVFFQNNTLFPFSEKIKWTPKTPISPMDTTIESPETVYNKIINTLTTLTLFQTRTFVIQTKCFPFSNLTNIKQKPERQKDSK